MVDSTILIAGVVAGAAPIVFATLGETLTEKAGLINLSLDGSILLSAMTAFVVSLQMQSLTAGFVAAALVGGLVAAVVAVFSVYLRQNQVAVGFVLTLMARDLAYFIGNPYARQQGLQVSPLPIPGLKDIPVIGPILFNHNLPVYASLVSIGIIWWFMFRTPWGLKLRAVGENPKAAFARGIDPRLTQLFYACMGGMLVGIGGATFSLCTKAGWGRPQGAEGTGWIALALVIFGGWHPLKTAGGAYLFALLQVMGIYFQGWFADVPAQVFQVAPFPLMIFTLLIISLSQKEAVLVWAEDRPVIRRFLEKFSSSAPSALGKPYQRDEY